MTTKYTPDHEWINIEDHEAASVGITHHAQDALGDVVFVDLPAIGSSFKKGDVAGVIESVKAAADLYMPVSGKVVEVNEALRADPSLANTRSDGPRLVLQGSRGRQGRVRPVDGRTRLRHACEKRLTTYRREIPPQEVTMPLSTQKPLFELENTAEFTARHIGVQADDERHMLSVIGAASRRALIEAIVPRSIARRRPMALPPVLSEAQALAELKRIAAHNKVLKSCIGQGYHGTHTPAVILRNVLENPAWYTAYTPYQAEISQGRLEALVNFQTMVCDLTGMAIAGASMLDEATAAAEAMTLAIRVGKSKSTPFFVADDVLPQTLEVVQTRARPLGITVLTGAADSCWRRRCIRGAAAVPRCQRRGARPEADQRRGACARWHGHRRRRPAGADADHSTRRNGRRHRGRQHAAFRHAHGQRRAACGVPGHPGRVQALDAGPAGGREHRCARRTGLPAGAADARAAHPPREGHQQHLHGTGAARRGGQHVRGLSRPRGPEANRAPRGQLHGGAGVGLAAARLHAGARKRLRHPARDHGRQDRRRDAGRARRGLQPAPRLGHESCGITLDETTTRADISVLWALFAGHQSLPGFEQFEKGIASLIPPSLARTSTFLTHPVFNRHHSETDMLRYIRSLADKDLALDRTMIPLGSCTMKLNATSEMIPITWPEFADLHPFAPRDQLAGYDDAARAARSLAVPGHRLQRRQPATQRRLAG